MAVIPGETKKNIGVTMIKPSHMLVLGKLFIKRMCSALIMENLTRLEGERAMLKISYWFWV
jgi:hypothetical protein